MTSPSIVSIRFLVSGRLVEGLTVGEHHVTRVVLVLRFFLGIEVIQVAEELVESVVGREHFIPVAQVVLSELAGSITVRLQELRDRNVLRLEPEIGAREPDLEKAGAEARLARDEGGPARRAALFAVRVGEDHALVGDAVDVGGLVAHHAHVVGADVELADVVAPDDENVRPVLRGRGCGEQQSRTDAEEPSSHASSLHRERGARGPLGCGPR
jgi:hypothetical protein